MSTQDLFVEVVTRSDITAVEFGRRYFELLGEHAPRWCPGKYGFSEPVRAPFSMEALPDAWKPWLLWKSKRRGVAWGAVDMPVAAHERHSTLFVNAVLRESNSQLSALVQSLGESFCPDYGYAHLLTAKEIRGYNRPEVARWNDGPLMSVPLHLLQEAIPDLYWANLFGPPYVELFGAERIASAPVHSVVELSPDVFYLQLTPRIEDVYDQTRFNHHRDLAKEHLGIDAFWRPDGRPGDYRQPDFKLPGADELEAFQGDASTEDVERVLKACHDLPISPVLVQKALELADDSLSPSEPFNPFAAVWNSDGKVEFLAGIGDLAGMEPETLAELGRSVAPQATVTKGAGLITCTAVSIKSAEREVSAELRLVLYAGSEQCALRICVQQRDEDEMDVRMVQLVDA